MTILRTWNREVFMNVFMFKHLSRFVIAIASFLEIVLWKFIYKDVIVPTLPWILPWIHLVQRNKVVSQRHSQSCFEIKKNERGVPRRFCKENAKDRGKMIKRPRHTHLAVSRIESCIIRWFSRMKIFRGGGGNRALNWSGAGCSPGARMRRDLQRGRDSGWRVYNAGETSRIIKRKHGCPRITHLDGRKLDLRGWNWLTRTSHRFSRHKRYLCPGLSDYKRFFKGTFVSLLLLFLFFFRKQEGKYHLDGLH